MDELEQLIYEKYGNNVKMHYFLKDINGLRFITRENKKFLQQHKTIRVEFIEPQWIAGNFFIYDCFDVWIDVPLVE